MALGAVLQLEPRTLDALDLRAAIAAELEDPPRLLPSRVAESAVRDNASEYAERLDAIVRAGFSPAVRELVWASKSRLGHRPLAVLPIRDRVLYRALVDVLAPKLAPYDVRDRTYEEFERAPLASAAGGYVASADVAAFYQYVDHTLLARRIVESAGDADLSRALPQILGAFFDQGFGLPQDNRVSDVLGELFIAPVERALSRSGLSLARYNDDFRIMTSSLTAAYEAIERIQYELQVVGLTLNEEKSRVRSRETYEAGLGLVDRKTEEALEGQEVDLTLIDSYTGEPIDPDPADVAEALREARSRAGHALFEETLESYFRDEMDVVQRLTARQLLVRALSILGGLASPAAAGMGRRVLAVDPSLSPAYSRYLGRLVEAGHGAQVAAEVADLLDIDTYAPGWQRAWLLQPFVSRDLAVPVETQRFLRTFAISSAPAAVRARATLVLAVHDACTVEEVGLQFDAAPTASRHDLAAAAALVSPGTSSVLRAIRGEGVELDWIVRRVQSAPDDVSWL